MIARIRLYLGSLFAGPDTTDTERRIADIRASLADTSARLQRTLDEMTAALERASEVTS